MTVFTMYERTWKYMYEHLTIVRRVRSCTRTRIEICSHNPKPSYSRLRHEDQYSKGLNLAAISKHLLTTTIKWFFRDCKELHNSLVTHTGVWKGGGGVKRILGVIPNSIKISTSFFIWTLALELQIYDSGIWNQEHIMKHWDAFSLPPPPPPPTPPPIQPWLCQWVTCMPMTLPHTKFKLVTFW